MNDRDGLSLERIVSPTSSAEIAEIVRAAVAVNDAIYPQGGGTHAAWACRPTRQGIVLATQGLNRVLEHAADDMTVTVEAGVTLGELQSRLKEKNQWLPLDAAFASHATVGGALAVGASGPRRLGYGTLRDYVLGLTAVDGLGKLYSTGGRVVKNAAGYNVHRLSVGAWGTLGVIAEATFLVRTLPESRIAVAFDLPNAAASERALEEISLSRLRTVAVELLFGDEYATVAELPPLTGGAYARLIVGFEGDASETPRLVEALRNLLHAAQVEQIAEFVDDGAERVWRSLTESTRHAEVRVLPSQTIDAVETLRTLDSESRIDASAGDGVLNVRFSAEKAASDADPAAFAQFIVEQARPAIEALGGNLIVRAAPNGAIVNASARFGVVGATLPIMRGLKDRFDPNHILNPGRYFFTDE